MCRKSFDCTPVSPKPKGDILVSACPSARPSVRRWKETCPLCIFHNSNRIHFIYTHLINQVQKVCHVLSFYKTSRIWILLNVFNSWLAWLYFSRRLLAAVADSFVVRAGDYGSHRLLSSESARALYKYKQSPNRTAKMIHPRNSNSNANSKSNSNWDIDVCLYWELTSYVLLELSECYRVSRYSWVENRYWFADAFPWILLSVAFVIRVAVAYSKNFVILDIW